VAVIRNEQTITDVWVDSGAFFVSDDGGATWQRRSLPEQYRLTWVRDADVNASGRSFLVGAGGFTASAEGETVTLPVTAQQQPVDGE